MATRGKAFPLTYMGVRMNVFGIVATVVVAGLVVLMIVALVRMIFKPDHKSVMEHLRGNDEKYE